VLNLPSKERSALLGVDVSPAARSSSRSNSIRDRQMGKVVRERRSGSIEELRRYGPLQHFPIISCKAFDRFQTLTMTLKRLILPSAFQWMISTPLISTRRNCHGNSSTAEVLP